MKSLLATKYIKIYKRSLLQNLCCCFSLVACRLTQVDKKCQKRLPSFFHCFKSKKVYGGHKPTPTEGWSDIAIDCDFRKWAYCCRSGIVQLQKINKFGSASSHASKFSFFESYTGILKIIFSSENLDILSFYFHFFFFFLGPQNGQSKGFFGFTFQLLNDLKKTFPRSPGF